MPNATITDTVLNKPFARKTDFVNALDTALINAGFGSSTDTFDITDTNASTQYGGTTFNASNAGSLTGLVKNVVLSGATQGTVQCVFFTRTAYSSTWGGVGVNTSLTENCFTIGNYIILGGWNTSTKVPSSTNAGNAIGGYTADYSACLTQAVSTTDSRNAYTSGSVSSSFRAALGHQYQGAANTSDSTNFPYNFTNPVFFKAVSHPEIRGVFIQQFNRPVTFLGYIRPSTLPSWWNENSFPYCFHTLNGDFLTLRSFYGSSTSPYTGSIITTNYTVGTFPTGAGNTANSNRRDILSAPVLTSTSGVVGKFSSDIVLVAYTNLAQFDRLVVTAGAEEYIVLSPYRVGRAATSDSSPATYSGNIDAATYGIGVRVV